MTQYENQLASLRLEVKRLRNYDCYVKEIPYQEIETEVRSFLSEFSIFIISRIIFKYGMLDIVARYAYASGSVNARAFSVGDSSGVTRVDAREARARR